MEGYEAYCRGEVSSYIYKGKGIRKLPLNLSEAATVCSSADDYFSGLFDPQSIYYRRGIMIFLPELELPIGVIKLKGERTLLGFLSAYDGKDFPMLRDNIHYISYDLANALEKEDMPVLPPRIWGAAVLPFIHTLPCRPLELSLRREFAPFSQRLRTRIVEESKSVATELDFIDFNTHILGYSEEHREEI